MTPADRSRDRELREMAYWRSKGWRVDDAGKVPAGYFPRVVRGVRTLVARLKRKDLFAVPSENRAGADFVAFHEPTVTWALVQVTTSPFVKVRDGYADRNAAHGPPPFALGVPTWNDGDVAEHEAEPTPDDVIERPGDVGESTVQVIVSYGKAKGRVTAERRWWVP